MTSTMNVSGTLRTKARATMSTTTNPYLFEATSTNFNTKKTVGSSFFRTSTIYSAMIMLLTMTTNSCFAFIIPIQQQQQLQTQGGRKKYPQGGRFVDGRNCLESTGTRFVRKQQQQLQVFHYHSQRNSLIIMSATGFVGLGIMGEGMAARLLSEGVAGSEENPLIVWNRTGSKCKALQEKFPDKVVIAKDSAKEVIEACSITYSILSTPEVSKIVFEDENGVLAGVSDGKSIVDCATLAEEDMKRMDAAVREKGGRFLEAPVSGSKGPAATGALIFLCAGSEDLFNEIKDTGLAAMGKASHFFSTEVGYGTRAKLVVNSLMGTMLAAYGESLALSESIGLDPTKMIEVIGQGAIQSPMFALKGPKMIVKDHAPNFPLKHAHKDMALASDMAKAAEVEFSIIDQAEKVFREAREDTDLNVADEDFSAVFEKIHKESNSEFSKKRMS